MWVMGQLCDGSHGSWVTKDDPFPSLDSRERERDVREMCFYCEVYSKCEVCMKVSQVRHKGYFNVILELFYMVVTCIMYDIQTVYLYISISCPRYL